ncbi:DNA mismatch repair protein [Actinomortierella ambigua]|nr:DNA mismatch repair protein [Actinomortierella ambigua]
MTSIRPLQPSIIDAVRATIVIHSLEQCVSELVQNSLDAEATSIEIKIDPSTFSLQVSDNGQGITRANLGRIGPRYTLASIAEMSLLEILSKPRHQDHAFMALFRGGDRLLLEESPKPLRYGHGVTISVRDLFFKFPVRQRQLSEQSAHQDIEGVKRVVEKLALAAPHVGFIVVDALRGTKVVNLRKADSLQSRIRALLGPSIASSLIAVRSVTPDDGSPSDIACIGFISTTGYFNQLHQHLFLNRRPIQSQTIQSAIHQVFQQSNFGKERSSVDSEGRRVKERFPVYVLSLTCRSDWYDIFADPAKTTVLFKEEERVVQLVRGVVAQFLCDQHFMSRTAAARLLEQRSSSPTSAARKRRRQDPGSSGADAEEVISEYTPLAAGSDPYLQLPYVRPSRSLRIVPPSGASLDEGHDDWEDELHFELDSDWIHALTEDDFVPDDERDRSLAHDHNTLSESFRPPKPNLKRASLLPRADSKREVNRHRLSSLLAQDALRKWVNPVLPTAPRPIPSGPPLKPPSSAIGQPFNMTNQTAIKGESGSGPGTSFTLPAGFSSASSQRSEYFLSDEGGYHPRDQQQQYHQLLASVVLTKESIRKAEVIAQIDTKFILISLHLQTKQQPATIPSPSPLPSTLTSAPTTALGTASPETLRLKVLVAVDQHAAHERVRVERMMREFCQCSESVSPPPIPSPDTPVAVRDMSGRDGGSSHLGTGRTPCQAVNITMLPPIKVTLTQREWALARQFEERLFRWGIKVTCKKMSWKAAKKKEKKRRRRRDVHNNGGGSCGDSHDQEVDDKDGDEIYEEDGCEGEDEDEDPTETVSRHFPEYQASSYSLRSSTSTVENLLLQQDNIQGSIVCLPRLIADRCVVDGGLAQDLIKETLAEMEATPLRIPSRGAMTEDGSDGRDSGGGGGTGYRHHPWVQCMRGCPRAILDILYSKACRGAIMFSDVLRKDECQDLVRDLGQCAFPFQCAHGRPSAVPLAILDQQVDPPPSPQSTAEQRRAREVKARTRGISQWKQWLVSSSS